MYGYNSPYWYTDRAYPLPYGGTHAYHNTVTLGGYADVLPNGMTSLHWQSSSR